jgi:hypothetical protein
MRAISVEMVLAAVGEILARNPDSNRDPSGAAENQAEPRELPA